MERDSVQRLRWSDPCFGAFRVVASSLVLMVPALCGARDRRRLRIVPPRRGDAARRRDSERPDGGRRHRSSCRDPRGGRRRGRRADQASAWIEGGLSAAVGEDALRRAGKARRGWTSRSMRSAIRARRRRSSSACRRRHFVPGQVSLLRIPLESRCIVYPVTPRGASKVPGPLSGPTCTDAGDLHHGDLPVDPTCLRRRLEPYAKNWPTNAPDRCKPRNGGPPDLQVGTGQSYYLPLGEGPGPPGRSRAAGGAPHLDRDAHEEPETSRDRRPRSSESSPRRERPSRPPRSHSRTLPTKGATASFMAFATSSTTRGSTTSSFSESRSTSR